MRVQQSAQVSHINHIMHKSDKTNIILTGFMGTGKTTVGTLLAKKLKRQFIDTDQLIETRQGMTIPAIFADLGESAFRRMEADLARELADKEGLVISTGGRFMLNPANVDALSSKGRIFCLVATPKEIIARLTKDPDNRRPLLNVPDPGEQITRLLQERQKGYQRFIKLATDGRQPEEVVENLFQLLKKNPQPLTAEIPERP